MMHARDGRSLQYICIQLNVNLQISTLLHGFSVKFILTLLILLNFSYELGQVKLDNHLELNLVSMLFKMFTY